MTRVWENAREEEIMKAGSSWEGRPEGGEQGGRKRLATGWASDKGRLQRGGIGVDSRALVGRAFS